MQLYIKDNILSTPLEVWRLALSKYNLSRKGGFAPLESHFSKPRK